MEPTETIQKYNKMYTSNAHSSSPSFLFAEHVDSLCNYVTCP